MFHGKCWSPGFPATTVCVMTARQPRFESSDSHPLVACFALLLPGFPMSCTRDSVLNFTLIDRPVNEGPPWRPPSTCCFGEAAPPAQPSPPSLPSQGFQGQVRYGPVLLYGSIASGILISVRIRRTKNLAFPPASNKNII